MTADLWTVFMDKLTTQGKLDEFCNLTDMDIDKWLDDNDMGVTMDQLVAASPSFEMSDDDLENVVGGGAPMGNLQNTVQLFAAGCTFC